MYRKKSPEIQTEEQEFVDQRVRCLQSELSDREAKEIAFEDIANEFRVPLQRFVAYMVDNNNGVGRDLAEDIVQETLMKAWAAMGKLQVSTKSSLPAWLYAIARNVALNKIRYRNNHSVEYFMDIDSAASGVVSMNSEFANPEVVLEFHEAVASLDVLPESQRKALFLTAWYGLKYHEVATKENAVSDKAIKSVVQRARTNARSAIGEVSLLNS